MKSLTEFLTFKCGGHKLFVVIKPGFLHLSDKIIDRMNEAGWVIDKTILKKLLLSEAKRLYKVHEKESFYKDLCAYMSSDISRAFIFKKSNRVVEDPFDIMNKIKEEIRTEYGESDMRNVIHSSDSYESMLNEAGIYFNL